MNRSNNTNETNVDLDSLSLQALLNREPADIAYLFVGSVTSFVNILLILTIIKSKKLHTRCYFLVANVSAAAVLYSLSFFFTAVKRIARLNLRISEVQSVAGCNLEMFTCYLGQSACAAVPLTTAIDRLLATMAPIAYKNKGKYTAAVLAAVAWSYALIDSGFTFYDKNLHEIALNCNLISATDVLYEIQSGCAIALAVLVVLLYVCVMMALSRQITLAKIKSESVALAKAHLQMKVAKSLSVDGCVHLVTQVATRVGLAMLPLFPNLNKWTSASYMRITIFVGLMATFFVFFLLNSEFRRSVMHLFKWVPGLNKVGTKLDGNTVFASQFNRQGKCKEDNPTNLLR